MYFPSDKLYIETKAIKKGEKKVKVEIQKLTLWALKELKVTILNVVFSLKNNGALPSLEVVFELQKDYNALHEDPQYPYNERSNKMLASKYLSIKQELEIEGFETYKSGDFHMSYSVFSKVAIVECLNKLKDSGVESLKEKYLPKGIWEIAINHGSIIVFYLTEAERLANEVSGLNDQIRNELTDLARQHDEFGYLDKDSFYFASDSKENLDKNYGGSWHDYYR